MASKLEAVFKLIDQASAPGSKIAQMFDKIDSAARKLVGHDASKMLDNVSNAAKACGPALTSVAEGMAGLTVAAAGIAVGAAGAVYGLAKFALEASETKRRTVASLTAIEGSADGVAETMERFKVMASNAGQDDGKLLGMYRKLRLLGMGADESEKSIAAMLDATAHGSESSGEALLGMLEKIKANGEFKISTKALPEVGLTKDAVFASLRSIERYKNATNAALESAMESGAITADEGAASILRAANAQFDNGKGLGTAAANILGGSIGGRLQAVKNAVSDLFEDTDNAPLVNALRTIEDTLKSPAGKAAVSSLTQMLADMGTKLAAIATPENITSFVKGLGTLADVMVALTGGLLGGMADGFMQVIKPLGDVMRDLGIGGDGMLTFKDVMHSVGVAVGVVAAIFVYGFGAIAAIVYGFVEVVRVSAKWIGDHFATIAPYVYDLAAAIMAPIGIMIAVVTAASIAIATPFIAVGAAIYAAYVWITDGSDAVSKLLSSWVDIGANIVNGIWSGITGAWDALTGNTVKLFATLPEDVKKTLGIHSPSRVFMDIGHNVMTGMTIGIENEARNTNAAMDQIAEDVGSTGFSQLQPAAPGGGARSSHVSLGEFHYHAAPGESVEAGTKNALESLRSKVADMLEEVAIELGALPSAAG